MTWPSTTRGRCNDRDGELPAADVRGADRGPADRLSRGLLAGGAGPGLRVVRSQPGLVPAGVHEQPAAERLRHPVQRPAAGHSVFHADGRPAGEVRAGGRHARFHGPALRPGARGPGLLGDHRRLHPRGHHRHRRRPGHRDGHDLAAGHDALRLQHALRHRRAGRLGHDHAAGAALAGARRAGRPARPLRGRYVQGRLGSVDPAGADLRALHLHPRPAQARAGARRAQGSAHAAGLGPVGEMPARHHPVGRADLRGARVDGRAARHRHRHLHAHRGRRDGRGRRLSAGRPAPAPELAAGARHHAGHHAHHGHGGLDPDRLTHLLAGVPGRRGRALDRADAEPPARRPDRLPDRRQHLHLLSGLLPRLLRDRLHHPAAAGPGGQQAGHRPRVVRRDAVREHADQLHAPAVRLRAVLPARHRRHVVQERLAAQKGRVQRHLPRRPALGGHAAHPRGHRGLLPADGDGLPRQGEARRPESGLRAAAADGRE
mmetsp:Transcript_34309/g.62497  ORF Transcript_34309/g.62497 Transcript_34309/m.62497 type:complete len:488 (-) Transcript_34309:1060-2523(-)